MVALGAKVSLQFEWQHYLAIISGNFIVFAVFLSLCACCYKRKQSLQSEDDESDSESDHDSNHNNRDSFGRSISLVSQRPLLDRRYTRKFSTNFPPIDYDRPGSGNQLYQRSESGGLHDNLDKTFSPFQSVNIQPSYEDLVPYKSLFARSISMPQLIPEAPAAQTDELGTIYFSVSYDAPVHAVSILIEKAVNLPAVDLRGSSDPYVKVFLFPDKKQTFETRVVKKNLNPIWNEVFSFEGFPEDKLKQKRLYLQIFDHDRFSRNDAIGEAEIVFRSISLQQEPVEFRKELRPCKYARGSYLGDLLISMCYNPTANRITIVVLQASRLRTTDISGRSDPYVKVYLLYSGNREDKKKTQVIKRCLNPVWNEVMEFETPIDKIRGISFVFTIMDFDRVMPNKYVGKVIIGYSTTGTSLKHWTDVLTNPGKPIAMWHRIVKY